MKVKGVLAYVTYGIKGVRDGEFRTAEVLADTLVAIVHRYESHLF